MVRQHRRWHTEDGPVTVLVEFMLAQSETAAAVASTLADQIAHNLSWRPGFLTCTLMVSADSGRLITTARWASEDAWFAASRRPDGHVPQTLSEPDLHWLQCPDSGTTLTASLAGAGATLNRVEILHEVQTLTTLAATSPHPPRPKLGLTPQHANLPRVN